MEPRGGLEGSERGSRLRCKSRSRQPAAAALPCVSHPPLCADAAERAARVCAARIWTARDACSASAGHAGAAPPGAGHAPTAGPLHGSECGQVHALVWNMLHPPMHGLPPVKLKYGAPRSSPLAHAPPHRRLRGGARWRWLGAPSWPLEGLRDTAYFKYIYENHQGHHVLGGQANYNVRTPSAAHAPRAPPRRRVTWSGCLARSAARSPTTCLARTSRPPRGSSGCARCPAPRASGGASRSSRRACRRRRLLRRARPPSGTSRRPRSSTRPSPPEEGGARVERSGGGQGGRAAAGRLHFRS